MTCGWRKKKHKAKKGIKATLLRLPNLGQAASIILFLNAKEEKIL
jgi:hypothetical protein